MKDVMHQTVRGHALKGQGDINQLQYSGVALKLLALLERLNL
jgi:hypothetical protein